MIEFALSSTCDRLVSGVVIEFALSSTCDRLVSDFVIEFAQLCKLLEAVYRNKATVIPFKFLNLGFKKVNLT